MRFVVLQLRRFPFVCALAVASLAAATLEQMSLEALARESTAIVQGRVTGERTVQAGPLLYTVKTIAVERRWKGSEAATVEVSLPGGTVAGQRQIFGGAPLLEPGRDYVLFLWTGPSGRTQITGLSQGVCELEGAAGGEEHVVRRPSSDVVLAPGGAQAAGDGSLDLAFDEFSRRVEAALSGAAKP
ncbi:MAG: hypothetical protein KDC27_14925 [Acidobacteria bacterium]|nr:hypothetical protein [Acidobacteriota bacterium]